MLNGEAHKFLNAGVGHEGSVGDGVSGTPRAVIAVGKEYVNAILFSGRGYGEGRMKGLLALRVLRRPRIIWRDVRMMVDFLDLLRLISLGSIPFVPGSVRAVCRDCEMFEGRIVRPGWLQPKCCRTQLKPRIHRRDCCVAWL